MKIEPGGEDGGTEANFVMLSGKYQKEQIRLELEIAEGQAYEKN